MSSLRFDPFRELDRFTSEVLGTARTPRPMPLDAFREGEDYVLRFDLPGVDESSLQVTAENTTLTVRAERRAERPEGAAYLVAERPVGVFQRQIVLSNGLDLGAISAGYTDGVLTVTIPVAEHAKPRQISVDRTPAKHKGHKVISGDTANERTGRPAAVGA